MYGATTVKPDTSRSPGKKIDNDSSLGPPRSRAWVLHLHSDRLQQFEDVRVNEDTLWGVDDMVESQKSLHDMSAHLTRIVKTRDSTCTQCEGLRS